MGCGVQRMAIALKTVKELVPRLQQCHERALQALCGGDARVAIGLLTTLLEEEPGCVEARRLLCDACRAALGARPRGLAGCLAAARLAWPLRKRGPALLEAGRHREALRLADGMLPIDPWSPDVLRFLSRCLGAAVAPAAAIDPLEQAVSLHPGDPACWRDLGEQCLKAGRPARAVEAFERLTQLCPDDPVARDALRRARAAAARVPVAGGGPAGPDTAPPETAAGAPPAPDETAPAPDPVAQAEAAYARSPSVRACRELARLYLQTGRFDDAVRILQESFARMQADDPALVEELAGAYRARCGAVQAACARRARERPGGAAEAQQEAADAVRERDRLIFELHASLAARFPHDSRRRFEYAELLLARRQWDLAFEHYEAARNHPNLKARALAGMGRSLLGKGNPAEAVHCFREAVEAGLTGPLRDRLGVLYDFAMACEQAGCRAEATALLQEIFAQDRTFRDVAERLERLAATAPGAAPPRRPQ